MGLLSTVTKTTRYKVGYKGKVLGRRVIGSVTKKSDENSSGAASLLSGLGAAADNVEFAMVIDHDGRSISVAERYSSTTPSFYELKAIEPAAAGQSSIEKS